MQERLSSALVGLTVFLIFKALFFSESKIGAGRDANLPAPGVPADAFAGKLQRDSQSLRQRRPAPTDGAD